MPASAAVSSPIAVHSVEKPFLSGCLLSGTCCHGNQPYPTLQCVCVCVCVCVCEWCECSLIRFLELVRVVLERCKGESETKVANTISRYHYKVLRYIIGWSWYLAFYNTHFENPCCDTCIYMYMYMY